MSLRASANNESDQSQQLYCSVYKLLHKRRFHKN